VIGVAAVAVALLLASRLAYIPMWDGFIYASAIDRALTGPFDAAELRLAGHASQAYAAFVVAMQALARGHYWPLLLANGILLLIATGGFASLCAIVFPGEDFALDRSLLTAAFVLHPALLASVVQPGLDLPIVPAFLWTAVFLLRQRWVAAAAVGVALAFTKETGVLLYAALIGSVILWHYRIALGTATTRRDAIARLAVLSIPGVAFGLNMLYRSHSAPAGEPAVWNAGTAMIGQSLVRQLLVPRIDRHLASYLAIIGVLSFAWIPSLGAAGGLIATSIRRARAPFDWRTLAQSFTGPIGFVAILACATAYVLTRFATYANARYLLAVVPLLLLLFCAGLIAMRAPAGTRRLLIAGYVILSFISCVRTIDPLSRLLFGTVYFGERPLLRMTSITRECCSSGRDQLAYNLEFTTLASLTDDALAAMRPGDSTLIVLPDSTNWHAVPMLDPVTNRRTLDRSGPIYPLVVESDSAALFAHERSSAIYIGLPNGPAKRGLEQLAPSFDIGAERRFNRGPYAISVYRLTPRASEPARPVSATPPK
jgi:hypothetical protein